MVQIILSLFFLYIGLFVVSIKLQDNSIADIFWGLGFIFITVTSYCFSEDKSIVQNVVTLLIVIWGVRLTTYIGIKKYYHPNEDSRYANWRKRWKYFYIRSFFQVYILQGLFMLTIAIPIFLVNFSFSVENNIVTFLGCSIALMGLFYEIRADAELSHFKKTKKPGEILTTGLRQYSRYPQYFGESIFWLGISIIGSQVSIFSFSSWIVITFLLYYISGVPMLEKRYEGNTLYKIYSKNTPLFIPKFF